MFKNGWLGDASPTSLLDPPLPEPIVMNVSYHQGVEPFNFFGSGSVWVQQRFQILVQFR